MNPVVVIPSYWTERSETARTGRVGSYDHATPLTRPVPELARCLDSLERVRGILRVVVLLVSPPGCEEAARARVDGICRMHQALSPLVVGSREACLVGEVVERLAPRLEGDPVSLRGYGAIHNMGLAVAAALGHDVVVFLDDDELALDEDFLIDGVFALGNKTRQGLPIVAKSGYYLDRENSPYANVGRPRLRDRYWSKRVEFNEWMHRALTSTRISRSNYVCGGCFVVAAEAFTQVGFDPAITRGEDFDYLLNLRMRGYDVWFDNAWRVLHLLPRSPSRAARFLQDVYRWEYELAKLAVANATIGLRQVRPESLMPYPARWVSGGVRSRIALTSLLRAIFGPERLAYLKILLRGRHRARRWARDMASSYFAFETYWPQVMGCLWENKLVAGRLLASGVPRPVAQGEERADA